MSRFTIVPSPLEQRVGQTISERLHDVATAGAQLKDQLNSTLTDPELAAKSSHFLADLVAPTGLPFALLCVLLIVFSPVVSGKPVNPATGKSASMLQGVDFSWFPLDNPGIVSIPLSFLLGYIGTILSKDVPNADKVAEMSVRSLTGVGVEKSVAH